MRDEKSICAGASFASLSVRLQLSTLSMPPQAFRSTLSYSLEPGLRVLENGVKLEPKAPRDGAGRKEGDRLSLSGMKTGSATDEEDKFSKLVG